MGFFLYTRNILLEEKRYKLFVRYRYRTRSETVGACEIQRTRYFRCVLCRYCLSPLRTFRFGRVSRPSIARVMGYHNVPAGRPDYSSRRLVFRLPVSGTLYSDKWPFTRTTPYTIRNDAVFDFRRVHVVSSLSSSGREGVIRRTYKIASRRNTSGQVVRTHTGSTKGNSSLQQLVFV